MALFVKKKELKKTKKFFGKKENSNKISKIG